MGESRQPIFAQALSSALGGTDRRLLEPRLLRQLLQASQLAHAQGVPAELPPHVVQAAVKSWRAASSTVPSLSHLRVSGLLKTLRVEHSTMMGVGDGLPVIDIAIQPDASRVPVALQVPLAPVCFISVSVR